MVTSSDSDEMLSRVGLDDIGGSVSRVFEQPQENYTKLLLSAIPSPDRMCRWIGVRWGYRG